MNPLDLIRALLGTPTGRPITEARGRNRALRMKAQNDELLQRLRRLQAERERNASRHERVRARERRNPRSVGEMFDGSELMRGGRR